MNTSPVAANGTVYVPGSGDPGLVHAVDIESGEQEWQFESAGYCTATPALVDDTLYVGTWGRRFYALDAATGSPRWSRRFGQRFGSSSPAVVDETIYVGTYGDVPLTATGSEDTETVESCTFLALDTASGDTRWQYREFSGQIGINSSPAVADGRVYFGAEDGLYAPDADSGSEVWVREIPTQRDASPAVVDGTVYYGTELGSDGETPAQVWALDAATGETAWTAGIDDQILRRSPAVADGTVYVAASSARRCALGGSGGCSGVTRGRLYALDAESGDQQWIAPIKTDTRSSPAVADGVVYVGCKNGVSAVTTDGENAWRVNFGSLLSEPPYVESSPAVVDGYVFVGVSDGRLRAISSSSVL